MEKYTHSIDDLLAHHSGTRKDSLKRYIQKHFIENNDYIVQHVPSKIGSGSGGHNNEVILVTQRTMQLCISSFNLKTRYDPTLQALTIMSLENQTIGFIVACLDGVVQITRQFKIERYAVDLCFPQHMLVVECDEFGHVDRDESFEREREKRIIDSGFHIIRFNPNALGFDISKVINIICLRLFSNSK